jgi:hypothetical protein
VNELQNLEKQFEIENLKLENEILKEDINMIDETHFKDIRRWDEKFVYKITEEVAKACKKEGVSSSWVRDIKNRKFSFSTNTRQEIIIETNWSVGFIILDIIFSTFGFEEDGDEDIEDSLKTLCDSLDNQDPSYLLDILDRLFGGSYENTDILYEESLVTYLQTSDLFAMYQEYIDYVTSKNIHIKNDKKVKLLKIQHNEQKIKLLEKYMENTQIIM